MDKDEFEELLNIQRRMQSKLNQEREMDQSLDILAIINEMAPYPDQRIQKESLMYEAQSRGFSYDETEMILDKLIRDRILFEPEPGFIQRR